MTAARIFQRTLAILALMGVAGFAGARGLPMVRDQIRTIEGESLTGGLALCVVTVLAVALAARFLPDRRGRLWPWARVAAGVVLQAGLIVLATAWLYRDHLLAGSLAAGLAMVAAAAVCLLFYLDTVDLGPEWTVLWLAILSFESAAISVAVVSGVRDRPAAMWVHIGLAALPVVVLAGWGVRLAAGGHLGRQPRNPTSREVLTKSRRQVAAVPLWLQLAGLVAPATSFLAVLLPETADRLGSPFDTVAVGAGVTVVVAAVQRLLLAWLAPTPEYAALIPDEDPSGIHYEESVLRRMETRLRRSMATGEPVGALRDQVRVQQERVARIRREGGRQRNDYVWSSGLRGPAVAPAVVSIVRRVDHETGLDLDRVWPRIAMVLPREVFRSLRWAERSVAVLRTGVASLIVTAVAWAVAILTGLAGATNIVAAAGPLVIAGVLFVGLRSRVTNLYRRRADALEIYRFDLARSLHVPVPSDPRSFADMAGVLMGATPATILAPTTEAGTRLTADLQRSIVNQVGRRVSDEMRGFRNPVLSDAQLAGLADRVADRMVRKVEELERSLTEQTGRAVREAFEMATAGPPLVNFTGYLVIDQRNAGPRQTSGTIISAPVGGVLELMLAVVRDDQARVSAPRLETGDVFSVSEPIVIEGGRSEPEAEFEAIADSPTLHPRPSRETLVVGTRNAETRFVFDLPRLPGRHHIWFQLYQGGRLIQAVAVQVEALAGPAQVTEW